MNLASPISVLIVLGILILTYKKGKKLIYKPNRNRLIYLLERAEKIVSEYSGGYSGEYLSAEEFHKDLKQAIIDYKNGDTTKINEFYFWFAPTCAWDDFVGKEGIDLGNEIFEILIEIKNK